MIIMLMGDQDDVCYILFPDLERVCINDLLTRDLKGVMAEPADVLHHCKNLLVRSDQKQQETYQNKA